MENPRSDIALGAASGLIGLALLVPAYQEGAKVFLLPGDISPYFTPKLFLFCWIALSFGLLVKGVLALRGGTSAAPSRNWFAILGCFAVALIATGLMKPLGFLVVSPPAVFVSVLMLGYRNHLLNGVVSLAVSVGLYLMLVQIAGLPLPRAFWQG